MKQVIKNLLFLILLMLSFTSSQEKTCMNNIKCAEAAVVKEEATNEDAYAEIDLPLMPISKFILIQ